MKSSKKIFSRRALAYLLTLVLGSLLISSIVGPAYAATPSFFAPVFQPIGVAASQDRLLVTSPWCGDPRQVLSIDSSGSVSVFATLSPRGGGCFEEYIAISPGLPGFPANHAYVTQGQNIVEIDQSGNVLGTIVTIPSLSSSHNGIAFDHVGTFNGDMIVTSGLSGGEVWRVNSAHIPTLVGTVPGAPILEGPVVAPLGFAPYGGQILVASENANAVFAMDTLGTVSTVTSWPSAETVHAIPQNVCSFGSSGGAFFASIFPDHIEKWPPSDFAGLGGDVLVTSEDSGIGGGPNSIGRLTSTGGVITSSTFQNDVGQFEGAAFVDCAVPPLFTVTKDFRFTDVNFAATPAQLGTLLPMNDSKFNVSYVIQPKSGTVASTNPGQLYGVVTINGTGVQNITINDTFGTQFVINPAHIDGGVDVLRVNTTTGTATVITDTQVTASSVSATGPVDLTINLTTPLASDETVMVYIKYMTSLKGMSPDYSDFVNTAVVTANLVGSKTATATINFVPHA